MRAGPEVDGWMNAVGLHGHKTPPGMMHPINGFHIHLYDG